MDTRNDLPAERIPAGELAIQAAVHRCRRIVHMRAMVSAGASALPIPGLDVAVDAGLVAGILSEVNREFGLTPAQIGVLPPKEQMVALGAISSVGAAFAGRTVTAKLVGAVLAAAGPKIAARQASRWVPIAGQVAAAAMAFGALEWIGRRHIEECARVVRECDARLRAARGEPDTVEARDIEVLDREENG